MQSNSIGMNDDRRKNMKRLSGLIVLLLLFSVASGFAQESLLKNGDFEKGTSDWKGKYKVVDEGDNMVACIDVDRRKELAFEQKVRTRKIKDLALTFRYKTSTDYEGRGLVVRFSRPDGSSTFNTTDLAASTEWKEYFWNFGEIREAKKMTLIITAKDGKGKIYFDDFVMIAK